MPSISTKRKIRKFKKIKMQSLSTSSIVVSIYRIGETYFCAEGSIEKLKIDYLNFFGGKSIDRYEKLCNYLNNSYDVDLKKWNEIIDSGINQFTIGFQQDFINTKRLSKIRKIKNYIW
jgi:hypothetical protein